MNWGPTSLPPNLKESCRALCIYQHTVRLSNAMEYMYMYITILPCIWTSHALDGLLWYMYFVFDTIHNEVTVFTFPRSFDCVCCIHQHTAKYCSCQTLSEATGSDCVDTCHWAGLIQLAERLQFCLGTCTCTLYNDMWKSKRPQKL